jgi:SAM-dependent methyltransferase
MNTLRPPGLRQPAPTHPAHYDARYFRWQQPFGEFGGWANVTKFQPLIAAHHNVVDFGCGGAYLLRNLSCAGKLGIEVNEAARRAALANGIAVVPSADDAPREWADVVISNHALEHCLHPLRELAALVPVLKRGGRMVFVVPCETPRMRYRAGDISRHLYSWSPACLGNLFAEAGLVVEQCKPYVHKWPPGARHIARLGGRTVFDLACRAYGRVARSWFQVRIVARRD